MPISRAQLLEGKRFQRLALKETEMVEIIGKSNVIVMMLEGMYLERLSSSLSTETPVFTFFQISNQNIQSTTAEDAR
jgi:hypothetical protein